MIPVGLDLEKIILIFALNIKARLEFCSFLWSVRSVRANGKFPIVNAWNYFASKFRRENKNTFERKTKDPLLTTLSF